jgi:hypothetical protein
VDGKEAKAKFEVYCLRLGKALVGGQTIRNVLTEALSSNVTLEKAAKKILKSCCTGGETSRVGQRKLSKMRKCWEITGRRLMRWHCDAFLYFRSASCDWVPYYYVVVFALRFCSWERKGEVESGWPDGIEIKLFHASGIEDISIGLGNNNQISFFHSFPALDPISSL